MAAPFIRLLSRAVVPTETINLTTLSGGLSDEFSLRGFDGSDWMHGYQFAFKDQGGNQLGASPFGASYSTFPGVVTTHVTWDENDAFQSSPPIPNGSGWDERAGGWGWDPFTLNSGIHWPNIIADQKARRGHFIVETGGASFTVRATLSDGSYSSQQMALPLNGKGHFTVEFRSVATGTIDVEVRATSSFSNWNPAISWSCAWLESPVAPPRPRGNY